MFQQVPSVPLVPTAEPTVERGTTGTIWYPTLGTIGTVGTIGTLGWFLFCWVLSGLSVWRGSRPAPESWNNEARVICRRIGLTAQVAVRQSLKDGSPHVAGLFSSVVMMPPSAAAWTIEARQAALVHELTHIKRGGSAHAGDRAAGVRDLLVQSAGVVRRRRSCARAGARVRRRSAAIWRHAIGLRDTAARSRAQARLAVDTGNRAQHGSAIGDRGPVALDPGRRRARASAIDALAGRFRHRHDHDDDPRRAGGDARDAAPLTDVDPRPRRSR